MLGHGMKATERGALTSWRPQREGQVRTWKESDRVRGTHRLETAEGPREVEVRTRKESDRARGIHQLERGTRQDTERKPSEITIRDKGGKADPKLAVTFFQL